jgi:hypothetical protein
MNALIKRWRVAMSLAALALVTAGFGAPALAQDTPPASPAASESAPLFPWEMAPAEATEPAADSPAAAGEAPVIAPAAAEDVAMAAGGPASPVMVPASPVSKGDVAWMMTATVLVVMMVLPGVALFYGGMVRAKNMLSVLMQVMVVFSLIVVLWAVYGYSLAFGGEGLIIAGFDKLFLAGVGMDSLATPSATTSSCRSSSSSPSRPPSPASPAR